VLPEFPFYNLDNQEFLRITGGWVHYSYHSLIELKDLFQDIIASPEKEHELRENSYNSYIQSKYYTVKQTGNFFYQANKERPSIFFRRIKCVCISKAYKTLPPVRTKTEPIFNLTVLKFVNS